MTSAYLKELKAATDGIKKTLAALVKEPDGVNSLPDDEHGTPSPNSPAGIRKAARLRKQKTREKKTQGQSMMMDGDDDEDDGEDFDGDKGGVTELQEEEDSDAEREFLEFTFEDLLDEWSGDYNLDMSKAQVAMLLSKIRVDERVQAAEEMDVWMASNYRLHASSKQMLDKAEEGYQEEAVDLAALRQEIGSLCSTHNLETVQQMREYLEKVKKYRTNYLRQLKAKHSQDVFNHFWQGMAGTKRKMSEKRRKNSIFEDEGPEDDLTKANTMMNATKMKKQKTGVDSEVTPEAVAVQLLEIVSLQQDEITYLTTRQSMAAAKLKQVQQIQLNVKGQGGLPEGGAEYLSEMRTRLRMVYFEKLLATEAGRELIKKATGEKGNGLDSFNEIAVDCERLERKEKELKEQIAQTRTPADRIKALEDDITAKSREKYRNTMRSERNVYRRGAIQHEDSWKPPSSTAASIQEILEFFSTIKNFYPEIEANLKEVAATGTSLSVTADAKAEAEAAVAKQLGSEASMEEVKSEIEDMKVKLQGTKDANKALMDDKFRIEKELKALRMNAKAGGAGRRPSLEEDFSRQSSGNSGGYQKPLTSPSLGRPNQGGIRAMFDDRGVPNLDKNQEELPAPSTMQTEDQSRDYLKNLEEACATLEARLAELEEEKAALGQNAQVDSPAEGKGAGEKRKAKPGNEASTTQSETSEGRGHHADHHSGGKHSAPAAAETADATDEVLHNDSMASIKAEARAERKRKKKEEKKKKEPEPVEVIPEEVKASIKILLKMQEDLQELQGQCDDAEKRIRAAKLKQKVDKAAVPGEEQQKKGEQDSKGQEVPEENKRLRKEVTRRQRELNSLRKRWLDDKARQEKQAARMMTFVEPATRNLLQHPPPIPEESESEEEAASESESSSASAKDTEETRKEKEKEEENDKKSAPPSPTPTGSAWGAMPGAMRKRASQAPPNLSGLLQASSLEKPSSEAKPEASDEKSEEPNSTGTRLRGFNKLTMFQGAVNKVATGVRFAHANRDNADSQDDEREEKLKPMQKLAPRPSAILRQSRPSTAGQPGENKVAAPLQGLQGIAVAASSSAVPSRRSVSIRGLPEHTGDEEEGSSSATSSSSDESSSSSGRSQSPTAQAGTETWKRASKARQSLLQDSLARATQMVPVLVAEQRNSTLALAAGAEEGMRRNPMEVATASLRRMSQLQAGASPADFAASTANLQPQVAPVEEVSESESSGGEEA